MSLTSLSVLLAVVLLNIHLYGSALKPVPFRLRSVLFYHVAPFLRVNLHRGVKSENPKHPQKTIVATPRRATAVYNAVFLNEADLHSNHPQSQQQHTPQSTTMSENNLNSDSSSISNNQSSPQSLVECKRLLTELNRLILHPTELQEEETIARDWHNVALVMDRCLFLLYLLFTASLTVGTLILAPLFKHVPKPPNYHLLNITRD